MDNKDKIYSEYRLVRRFDYNDHLLVLFLPVFSVENY